MTDPAEERADSHKRPESANPSRSCPDYETVIRPLQSSPSMITAAPSI
jgi:hypothetical protein